MTIGEKLKIKREAANMSQKTLADKIGVNSAMIISNWELNKSTPDTDKLIKICILIRDNIQEETKNIRRREWNS